MALLPWNLNLLKEAKKLSKKVGTLLSWISRFGSFQMMVPSVYPEPYKVFRVKSNHHSVVKQLRSPRPRWIGFTSDDWNTARQLGLGMIPIVSHYRVLHILDFRWCKMISSTTKLSIGEKSGASHVSGATCLCHATTSTGRLKNPAALCCWWFRGDELELTAKGWFLT